MWAATYWQLLIVPTCCILTEAPKGKIHWVTVASRCTVVKLKPLFVKSVFMAYGLLCVCFDGLRLHA